MPHLDAQALVSDEEGLAFLAGVLEAPAERPAPRWLVEPAPLTAPSPLIAKAPVKRRRKPILVPEAA